jgi:hypothetical protein
MIKLETGKANSTFKGAAGAAPGVVKGRFQKGGSMGPLSSWFGGLQELS